MMILFSCMCAAELLCALDVFARHASSRITFLTLTIAGRSRGDVSSHQDVFQTFGFPEGQYEWFFENFAQFCVFFYGCPVHIYIYIYIYYTINYSLRSQYQNMRTSRLGTQGDKSRGPHTLELTSYVVNNCFIIQK